MNRFPIPLVLSAFLMSACAAPEYRGAALSFGDAAQTATELQAQRLNALTDRQEAAIRGQLAADRVLLVQSGGCGALISPEADVKECVVARQDGQDIPQPETFVSLSTLNKALGEYGASLSALAADTKEDGAAFSKSLLALVASVDGLTSTLDGTEPGKSDQSI